MHSLQVFLKNKPERYGINLFIVCDGRTGYILNLAVYSNEGSEESGIITLMSRLLAKYVDKGFTVYMDRYYTSSCGTQ